MVFLTVERMFYQKWFLSDIIIMNGQEQQIYTSKKKLDKYALLGLAGIVIGIFVEILVILEPFLAFSFLSGFATGSIELIKFFKINVLL